MYLKDEEIKKKECVYIYVHVCMYILQQDIVIVTVQLLSDVHSL